MKPKTLQGRVVHTYSSAFTPPPPTPIGSVLIAITPLAILAIGAIAYGIYDLVLFALSYIK